MRRDSSADEFWRSPKGRQRERERIEQATAAFIASGGTVRTVEPGAQNFRERSRDELNALAFATSEAAGKVVSNKRRKVRKAGVCGE